MTDPRRRHLTRKTPARGHSWATAAAGAAMAGLVQMKDRFKEGDVVVVMATSTWADSATTGCARRGTVEGEADR